MSKHIQLNQDMWATKESLEKHIEKKRWFFMIIGAIIIIAGGGWIQYIAGGLIVILSFTEQVSYTRWQQKQTTQRQPTQTK